MIADEIQIAKESSYSKVKNFEKLAAKEICCKYLDRKAGHLLEEVAIDFASAICLCLRKKNSNIAEVIFQIHDQVFLTARSEATTFMPCLFLRVLT